MNPIPFRTEFDPAYGRSVVAAPGIRRVVADNPSKYTGWGTGTYIVGEGEVAIVDPGPLLDSHIEAVLAAVATETVTHLLVTHTHADHSPAAAELARRTGATTYGFGPHPPETGSESTSEAEEHRDHDFVPDVTVRHGDRIVGAGFEFECLHTPGHISNHICYSERSRRVLFPGDHVMGWSTSVISPPDGRIDDYLAGLRLLLDRDEEVYFPTHGPPIAEPRPYVESLLEHRLEREAQLVDRLAPGPQTIVELVASMYADIRPELHEPAGRSVHAHLIKLIDEGRVVENADRFALA